jgi:glycogen operon protein
MEKENKGFVTKQGKDMPLGVSLQNNMFNFAVSMPGSSSCNLVLFKKGETDPAEVIPMEASALGVFTVAVQLPKKAGYTGYEYLYQAGEKFICDPYAAKINGRENFGEEPAYVRAEVYAPAEEAAPYKRHALSDLVLYKLHVRGFTMGNASGTKKKGTYAGLTEKILS